MKYKTNHTFAVCAYNKSPYLEECVSSLVNQTVKTNIEIYTSTPNTYIFEIGKKFNVPVFVNEKSGKGIQEDWNFAYNHAGTDYVTVAHQDDLYDKNYVKAFLYYSKKYRDWSIFFTDYTPIKHGKSDKRDINSVIRRILRLPVKNRKKADKKWRKKAILCMGNSIVCPLVTYNKKRLGSNVFTSKYHYNLDWDTFLKLACTDGRFLYCDMILGRYRVHDGATSKDFIENHNREKEDISMFEKFWPKWFVSFIMIFYRFAYKTYD